MNKQACFTVLERSFDMFSTFKIIAFILIGVSLIWKIVALATLNNKNVEFPVRQKKYMMLNGLCYMFLIPGVLLYVYVWMNQ